MEVIIDALISFSGCLFALVIWSLVKEKSVGNQEDGMIDGIKERSFTYDELKRTAQYYRGGVAIPKDHFDGYIKNSL